jgi:hypothetical protein
MKLSRRIQDYVLVALVTVLIWLYAEGRQVELFPKDGTTPVKVSVRVPGQNLVVISPSTPQVFEMQFKGPAAEIDRLINAVQGVLTIKPDFAEPGPQSVVLHQWVSSADELSDLHVSAIRIEPGTIPVELARLVTHRVKVAFDAGGVPLTSVPTLRAGDQELTEVTLRLPDTVEQLLGDDPEQFRLPVRVEDLGSLPPGVEHTVTGRVVVPEELKRDGNVTVTPPRVQVTLAIQRQVDKHTLPSVPVWVSGPPSEFNRVDVVLAEGSETIRNVTIHGPVDVIKQIRDGKINVTAALKLTAEELVKGRDQQKPGQVQFDLPPGVRLDAEVDTTVYYTVTLRRAS